LGRIVSAFSGPDKSRQKKQNHRLASALFLPHSVMECASDDENIAFPNDEGSFLNLARDLAGEDNEDFEIIVTVKADVSVPPKDQKTDIDWKNGIEGPLVNTFGRNLRN
jgi:hypothetical protein